VNLRILEKNADFVCMHCGVYVSANPLLSGVQNRNHCPSCLHSRHLDLYQAGDRLSACKAPMRPVGLTMKHAMKKYSRPGSGELMLIHLCRDCGAVSINRITADDDVAGIMAVLRSSFHLAAPLQARLNDMGIAPLTIRDVEMVEKQLRTATCPMFDGLAFGA
jgi:hypothetical protein